MLWGKPLLAWGIHKAKQSKYVENMRIIVSTDSEKYAEIAREHGAETPFLRPKEISGDRALDLEWAEHALEWLEKNEGYVPDVILQLRPTQPCTKVKDIDKCLDIFLEVRDRYDSLRTVFRSDLYELKMYTIADNVLKPIFKELNGIWEPYDGPRQYFPQNMIDYYPEEAKKAERYMHNGYIDIFNASVVATGSVSGEMIYPYIMEAADNIDIDTEENWKEAELVGAME